MGSETIKLRKKVLVCKNCVCREEQKLNTKFKWLSQGNVFYDQFNLI